jgi:hypothetical protein
MMGRLPTLGRPWSLSLGAEAVRFLRRGSLSRLRGGTRASALRLRGVIAQSDDFSAYG